MSQIHPTAVIEPGAQISDTAVIGPLCCVGPHVKVGPGTRLVNSVTILGRTTIGADNTIWPNAVIGADPQDLKFKGEPTEVIVGDANEIREQVTIHLGTEIGGGITRVGSHNLIMVGAHVAHDCNIGNHTVMANSVHLAGHVHVHDYVVLSGACAVHHYATVGRCSFVGGLTRIVHDVPPFMIVEGNPSKVRGLNIVGLTRREFPEQTVANLKDAYRRLYRGSAGGGDDGKVGATIAETTQKLEGDYPDDPVILELADFLKKVAKSRFGRSREAERPDNRAGAPVR